jgi:zinc/manganese transport system ATP-binding protein
MSAHITFRDLTLGYDGHPAVHHLNGVVEAGSLTASWAEGSGKSTLRRGSWGMLRRARRRDHADGIAAGEIAYLPQLIEIDRSFPATVMDLVALGLWRRCGMLGGLNRADRDSIDAALAAVGLSGFQRRSIDTLSGGQMQRALFARVLLQDARLILLDEPFNAVDTRTVADLLASCAAGMARSAPSWPSSTTSTSCAAIFPEPCSSRAARWPGATRTRP